MIICLAIQDSCHLRKNLKYKLNSHGQTIVESEGIAAQIVRTKHNLNPLAGNKILENVTAASFRTKLTIFC